MPIQTSWYIENRVLYYRLEGQVDFDDIQQLNDDYTHYAVQSSQPIHSIADLQQMENLKFSMKDIAQLRNVKTFGGWTVIVRGQGSTFGTVIQFFVKLSEQIFGMQLVVVNSIDAARQFLREKDPSLTETISA